MHTHARTCTCTYAHAHMHMHARTCTHTRKLREEAADPEEWNRVTRTQNWEQTDVYTVFSLELF